MKSAVLPVSWKTLQCLIFRYFERKVQLGYLAVQPMMCNISGCSEEYIQNSSNRRYRAYNNEDHHYEHRLYTTIIMMPNDVAGGEGDECNNDDVGNGNGNANDNDIPS